MSCQKCNSYWHKTPQMHDSVGENGGSLLAASSLACQTVHLPGIIRRARKSALEAVVHLGGANNSVRFGKSCEKGPWPCDRGPYNSHVARNDEEGGGSACDKEPPVTRPPPIVRGEGCARLRSGGARSLLRGCRGPARRMRGGGGLPRGGLSPRTCGGPGVSFPRGW